MMVPFLFFIHYQMIERLFFLDGASDDCSNTSLIGYCKITINNDYHF